jgi:hypothetical protein
MPLTGESTRLACCRRRLGDDHRVVWQGTPFGFSNQCRRMCSAGRRTPQASGLRSPFQLNRSGLGGIIDFLVWLLLKTYLEDAQQMGRKI